MFVTNLGCFPHLGQGGDVCSCERIGFCMPSKIFDKAPGNNLSNHPVDLWSFAARCRFRLTLVERSHHSNMRHHRIAATLADHADEVKAVAAALLQIDGVIAAVRTAGAGLAITSSLGCG